MQTFPYAYLHELHSIHIQLNIGVSVKQEATNLMFLHVCTAGMDDFAHCTKCASPSLSLIYSIKNVP